MVSQGSAAGFNESNPAYYGVDVGTSQRSVSYTYGPLTLKGVIFGKAETGGPTSFNAWADTATCSDASNGYTCVDYAIQNATFKAAQGVLKSTPQNLFNSVLLHRSTGTISGGWSGQYGSDLGQGPSCPSSVGDNVWSVQQQNAGSGNCTASPYSTGNNGGGMPGLTVILPTRAIKVTCKSACGTSDPKDPTTTLISQSNWGGLLTQLTSDLSGDSKYAARFAVTRNVNNNYPVLARCRLTIPYVNGYGVDECPDYIYGSGSAVTTADTTFNPSSSSSKRSEIEFTA